MISTNGLTKVFRAEGVETVALKEVSFRVNKGDFIAIMGPSGCGKTTLLNLLGLIDDASSGKYFFFGQDVYSLNEKQQTQLRKQNIGYVFQNFNLIDDLTIWENIELPLIYLGWKRKVRNKRVAEVISSMELDHRKKLFPAQLSGGQQQRVAVARAVVAKPPLILADEPTGNLDSLHGEEVMNILGRLNNEGTTIVMVTHSQSDAAYSHKIVHLFDGQIINENITKGV
jgi:putative ABC transport system ATP-binding protein